MRAPNPRYRVDRLPAESLRDNTIGSPAVRELAVYLPPGYHERPGRRYPVIYFLHGYGMDSRYLTVGSRSQVERGIPLALRLLYRGILKRLLWYETLDGMIRRGELAPFLLVQPDGSRHLPHRHGFRRLDGSAVTKGSLYTDSPYTGRFRTYILEEVIAAVDARYRTLPCREGRALMGGSMGGYGALLGERKARERGRRDLDDILDTCDLVYSRDRPLLPTIERDGDGKAARMDPAAWENWAASDLNRWIERAPDAFRGVRLLVNCEASDEFGFADGSRRFHDTLRRLGIEHEFEIYRDPLAARYSPHLFGIAWRILPGIRFCLAPAGG